MRYYVVEKQANKAYGPMDSKRIAQETIQAQYEGLKVIFPGRVKMEDVLDEKHVYIDGTLMAIYEIYSADQLPDPEEDNE